MRIEGEKKKKKRTIVCKYLLQCLVHNRGLIDNYFINKKVNIIHKSYKISNNRAFMQKILHSRQGEGM